MRVKAAAMLAALALSSAALSANWNNDPTAYRKIASSSAPAHKLLPRRALRAPEGFRQSAQQIGSDHRVLTHAFDHHIACEPVQMHRRADRQHHIVRVLRDHGRDHSR